MSSVDEILSKVGLQPVVHQNSNESHPQRGDSNPWIWLFAMLSLVEFLPFLFSIYLLYVFRRILARYLRDTFTYIGSERTDLQFGLTYSFNVGSELVSEVTYRFGGRSDGSRLRSLSSVEDGLPELE